MRRGAPHLLVAAVLWLTLAAAPATFSAEPSEEELLKAAYIYNFAKFTRWPPSLFGNPEAPLILCTAGTDPLVVALKRLGGKRVKERAVILQRLEALSSPERCHLLYVADSEGERLTTTLSTLGNRPVLTVSSLTNFSRRGGIVELYREKGRIRFFINRHQAREAGLSFSSRLLRLAELIDAEMAR